MLQIIKNDAKELTEKAFLVQQGANVRELIEDMFKTMYANKGIGLAANQIGQLKRIFIMDVRGLKLSVVNPIITMKQGGTVMSEEGCLSFPSKKVRVRRHKRVVLSGFNADWKPFKIILNGLASMCAQHELDHLNGITI